jgi:predicted nucleotidyltransferase
MGENTAYPESDIDIGILGPEKIDDFLMLRIRSDISGIPTLRRIDVVDLQSVDENLEKKF